MQAKQQAVEIQETNAFFVNTFFILCKENPSWHSILYCVCIYIYVYIKVDT